MSTEGTEHSVAEAYLTALRDNGIKYVFANAGTDFAPIIEALVRAGEGNSAIPTFMTVPHENVAMAMAQGYYKVCGELAGVMVHVTVGTANAVCGLINAARDNVPVLLAAGRTPLTEDGDAGSRNLNIHWGQEAFDQGAMVREYVKWDYELRGTQSVDQVVERAVDIAMSEPRGPVYLTLPREVLGGQASNGVKRRPRGAPLPPAPSAAAIERVADAIARAENPLIIAGRNFHTPESFGGLAALAGDYALPVAQTSAGHIPSSHPMSLGAVSKAALEAADLVLVFDSSVPWIPKAMQPAATATVIHIGSDPIYQRLPYRGFRSDLTVVGDSALAFGMIHEALRGKAKSMQAGIDARRKRMAATLEQAAQQRQKLLADAKGLAPIHPAWLAHCLNEVKDDDAILINELGVPQDHLKLEQPGCFLPGGGAGGLGRGLGEALGAKLAAPKRQVISAVGDGSYMFCVPTAAHFVAQAEKLATLTIVSNNLQWFAVRGATLGMYPNGRAAKANALPLVELTPSPDFAKTIEACSGYGETVNDPSKLHGALEKALDKVDGGQHSLLNVICRARG
ncbi:MAG: thiamine pyrophosphate-requiring protein [Rhodospirillales bacterium]